MFTELIAFNVNLTHPITTPSSEKLMEVINYWGPLYVSGLEDPGHDQNKGYGEARAIEFGLRLLGQQPLITRFQNNQLNIPEDVTPKVICPFEVSETAIRQLLANYEGAVFVSYRRGSTNALQMQKKLEQPLEQLLHEGASIGFRMILEMLNQQQSVERIDKYIERYFVNLTRHEISTRKGLVERCWPLPNAILG